MPPPAASAAVPTRPARPGNLATEDLLYLLHGLGLETGVSLDAVVAASHRSNRSSVTPALAIFPRARRHHHAGTVTIGLD